MSKEEIAAELERALKHKFVGELNNEQTLTEIEAYLKQYAENFDIKDLGEPRVTLNGNQLNITFEKENDQSQTHQISNKH